MGGRLTPDTVAICPEMIGNERAEQLATELASVGTRVLRMGAEAFGSFSQVKSPEGVAAAIPIPDEGLRALDDAAELVVAAVDLRDPGNMGALLRTADAADADGLITAGTCVDLYDPKVIRATAGSIFHLRAVTNVDPDEMLKWARERGISTVAGCLEGARRHTEIRYRSQTLLMVGNEANGLRPDVAARADLRAYIPMPGQTESLNVAVAAGILIWEILRQKTA